jgi:hypothetical protein
MSTVTPRDVLDNCLQCLHPVNPSSKVIIHTALLKQLNPPQWSSSPQRPYRQRCAHSGRLGVEDERQRTAHYGRSVNYDGRQKPTQYSGH